MDGSRIKRARTKGQQIKGKRVSVSRTGLKEQQTKRKGVKLSRVRDLTIIIIKIKYISKALNPSVSNLHDAASAVSLQLKLSKLHIQLKPSKERNQ